MNKYLAVFRISWQQVLVYRLNFSLWRFRSILQFLLVYFIWWSVFNLQSQVFGYNKSSILTYILLIALIRAIVLSSRVMDVAGQISEGNIVNFLIKPLGFIKYVLARDLADKLLNISFVVVEISLMIYLLKPEILIQKDFIILVLFIFTIFLALILYFSLSFIINMTAFWVENAWGAQFLLIIFLEGFAGGLFPIDIYKEPIRGILTFIIPVGIMMNFPVKSILGQLNLTLIIYAVFFSAVFLLISLKVWEFSLKQYSSASS